MTRTARITTAVVGAGVAVVVAATAAGVFTRAQEAADEPVVTVTVTAEPTPQPTTSADLESPAPIRTDLTAEVVRMEAVQGTATQPGEVAGAAVRFTIRVTNRTDAAVDLAGTVVNAVAGDDEEPAYPLSGPGGKEFPSTLAAGASATGVFVLAIPVDQRDHVSVTLDTGTDVPVVAFTGGAPR